MEAKDSVDVQVRRRLRELRLQRGLTLEDVAQTAQIDVSTLNRLESGKRRLALDRTPVSTAEMSSELQVHSVSFRLSAPRYLRFRSRVLTASRGITNFLARRVQGASADHRKLTLSVLPGSLHDPLRSPVVDPRCLGGSVDRRAVTM